jgi:predicted small lipoprotein YifL
MRALLPPVLLVLVLQGCGLKGPLYLPKPETQQNKEAQQKRPQQDQQN